MGYDYLAANLAALKERIDRAARRAGRSAASIRLVAVTKTQPLEVLVTARDLGLADFGENRVQEFLAKEPHLPGVAWHLIGHLQRNKVKQVVGRVSLIHSLDSLALAKEIEKRAALAGVVQPVLLEVNPAGEAAKTGLAPAAVAPLLKEIAGYTHLRVRGLMAMAPFVDDPEAVRPVFRAMAGLRREIESFSLPGINMDYLSMGMTNDFEIAIAEGANMVRIGTAIFGSRPA